MFLLLCNSTVKLFLAKFLSFKLKIFIQSRFRIRVLIGFSRGKDNLKQLFKKQDVYLKVVIFI